VAGTALESTDGGRGRILDTVRKIPIWAQGATHPRPTLACISPLTGDTEAKEISGKSALSFSLRSGSRRTSRVRLSSNLHEPSESVQWIRSASPEHHNGPGDPKPLARRHLHY
jgi:hypothetical protein